MNCVGVGPRLTAMVSGKLTAEEEKSVRAHLAGCEPCRSLCDSLEEAWSALDDLVSREGIESRHGLRGVRRLIAAAGGARDGEPAEARAGEPAGEPTVQPARVLAGTRRIPASILAAAATLVLGFAAGRALAPTPDRSALEARVDALEQEMLAARLGSDDVVVRLSAIDAITAAGTTRPRVVDALLRALTEDPSVNVRLAAVEALSAALAERDVALRAARLLAAEPSVLVQLALTERLAALDDAELRRAVARAIPRDALLPEARRRFEELLGGST